MYQGQRTICTVDRSGVPPYVLKLVEDFRGTPQINPPRHLVRYLPKSNLQV